MMEIERLKLQISSLQKKISPSKSTWDNIKTNRSKLDVILKDRDSAMERFNNKLFGGKNAK